MSNPFTLTPTITPSPKFQCQCLTFPLTSPLTIPPIHQPYSLESGTDLNFPKLPLSNLEMVDNLTKNLPEFSFCEQCQKIKCEGCLSEEVMFNYCPECLFEIQGGIVQADKMKCWRNCLSCPICPAPLTLMESIVDPSNPDLFIDTLPDMSSDEKGIRSFYYLCYSCRYDTREVGLKLDKLSYLANYVTEQDRLSDPRYSEVSTLQMHYDLKYMVPYYFEFNPSLYAIEEVDGFDVRVNDLFRLKNKEYQSQIKDNNKKNDEDKFHFEMKNVTELSQTPSMDQLLSGDVENKNKSKIYPQRQKLRCRTIKKCLDCNTTVVQPMNKASQAHKFEFKYPAYKYVPDLKLLHLPNTIKSGDKLGLGLKVTNPLFFKCFIELSTPLSKEWELKDELNNNQLPKEFNHKVSFPTPKFSIDGIESHLDPTDLDYDIPLPNKELIDEDSAELDGLMLVNMDLTIEKVKELNFDQNNPYIALVDKDRNSSTILFNVEIGECVDRVIIPILMTYTTKLPPNDKEDEAKQQPNQYITRHNWVYLGLTQS